MLNLEVIPFERELDLSKYSLTDEENNLKGTFIDENRIDTVRLVELIERRSRYEKLTIEEFTGSEDFYKIIFNTCYNASVSDDKFVCLLDYFNEEIASYLKTFFSVNNLGVVTDSHVDLDRRYDASYATYGRYFIKIKLNENITFEDIRKVYSSELEKLNLSIEDIEKRDGNQLTKKRKNSN